MTNLTTGKKKKGGLEKTLSTENKHNPPLSLLQSWTALRPPSGEPESILTKCLEGKVDCLGIGLMEFPKMPWANAHVFEDGTGLSYNLTLGSIINLGLLQTVVLKPMSSVLVTVWTPALVPITYVTSAVMPHQIG